MSHFMPQDLDCQRAAKEQRVFQGSMPIASFERWAELLLQPQGEVQYAWRFFENEAKQCLASLKLRAVVQLTCQRCNEPFLFEIDACVEMQQVLTEKEAEQLPLAIQPLYTNALHHIEPHTVMEDELILALPMFPMHEKKDCSLSENQAYYASSEVEQNHTYKAFAGLDRLANLKEKKSGSSTK